MNRFPRWLMPVLVPTVLVLLAAGIWFYRSQQEDLRRNAHANLQAITQLKVDQIVAWRTARLADASVLMASPFLIDGVTRWMTDPRPEAGQEILVRFRSMQEQYHYQDVLLADTEGHVRLSLSGNTGPLHAEATQAMAVALKERRAVFIELHRSPTDQAPHLGVVAPLFNANVPQPSPAAVIILQIDAEQFLYPLVQSWPTPSPTAETLIVRREGQDVLFLNELRHQQGATLNLRIPLSRKNVPAVQAVLGQEGIVEGQDYRGVEVLSVLKAIPDSNWYMVAKVDKTEVFADWQTRSALILALVLGCLVAVTATAGLVWQRNDKQHYRSMLQARDALRESEVRYRRALDNMLEGCQIVGFDWRYLYVNDSAARFGRQAKQDLLGHAVTERYPGIEDTDLFHVLRRCMEDRTAQLSEQEFTYPDGTKAWFVLSIQPIPEGLFILSLDITERKRMEHALRQSEERHRTTLLSVGDGVIATDAAGRVDTLNPVAETLTGWPLVEAVNRPLDEVFNIVNEETRRPVESPVARVLREGIVVGLANHTLLVARDGRECPIADSGAPIRDADGALTGVVLVFRDQTEERALQRALLDSRSELRAIFDGTPVMICVLDADRRVLTANRTFFETSGWPDAELRSDRACGVLGCINSLDDPRGCGYGPNCSTCALRMALADTMDNGVPHQHIEGRLTLQRHDRRQEMVLLGATTRFPSANQPRVLLTLLDITDLKRAQEERETLQGQLVQAQKMEAVGRLAGGVAHDFNNMLQAILGHTELALMETEPDSSLRHHFDQIWNSAQPPPTSPANSSPSPEDKRSRLRSCT